MKSENTMEETKLLEPVVESTQEEVNKTFPYSCVKKLRTECSRYRTAFKELKAAYNDFPPECVQEYKTLKETFAKQEEERSQRESNAQKVKELITKIAASKEAIAPEQVAVLLMDTVHAMHLQAGQPRGVAPTVNDLGAGAPACPSPAEIEQLVTDFLNNNLHLVRNKSDKKGADSAPNISDVISVEQISAMTVQQYGQNRDRILKTIGVRG